MPNLTPVMLKIIIPALASIIVAIIATWGTIQVAGGRINEIDKKATTLEDLTRLPVGSVLASMLPPKEFAAAVGDPADFDPAKTRWTLADDKGRMPGTKWAEVTNNSVIPDLRGMFLRGLNVGRSDGNQDPEDGRAAGQRQQDDFKSHAHSYKDVYVGGNDGEAKVGAGGNWNRSTNEKETSAAGGSETRPKNVAVFYYIRVR